MKKKEAQTTPSVTDSATSLDTSQVSGKKGKKSKAMIIIIIIVLLVVIATLAGVIYFLMHQKDEDSSSNPKRDTVVTMDNKDEILADLNNKVADGLFEVKMNVEWSFDNSSAPSEDAYVANNVTNSNTVYFDVTVDGTGETVYESPYIPVGSELKNITLKSALTAGTYPCTLTYHLIDDDYEEVSNLSVALTLYVLN